MALKSSEKTMIIVCKDTREELRKCGKKGETYDDIIVRLLGNGK